MSHKSDLVPVTRPGSLADRRPDLADAAEDFARASLSDATHRAARADWRVFSEWCAAQGVTSMPATIETAVAFLTEQSGSKAVATLLRYRATLGKMHKLRGHLSPFSDERVKMVLAGIRRKKGVAQDRKGAATLDFAVAGDGPVELRDRAVVLLGLFTAFRRSELSSLDVEDLSWIDEGLIVHLRRSKTDQEGVGRFVPVPRLDEAPEQCAVRAVRAWLDVAGVKSGALFLGNGRHGLTKRRLGPRGIADVVKRAAKKIGKDGAKFSGHSLRAGFVTMAWEAGYSLESIMAQTGHQKIDTVKRYIRGTDLVNPFKRSQIAAMMKAIAEKYANHKESP